MEVKDINSSAAQLFLKTVANAAGGAALGAGFSSLLSMGSSQSIDSAADLKPSAAEMPSAENKSSAPLKNNRESRRNESKAAPTSATKENKKNKVADKPENNGVAVADAPLKPQAAKSAETPETAEAPAKIAAPENITDVPPVETSEVQPVQPQNIVMTEVDGKSTGGMEAVLLSQGVDVVLTGDSIAFTDSSMTLEALSALPEVHVLTADGTVKTMTGAELAAQVSSAEANGALPQIPFAEAIKEVEIPQELVTKAAQFAKEAAAAPQAETSAVYADAELAAQALQLDEKAMDGRKLKVEVTLKAEQGEKIAAAGSNELIKDRLSLEQALEAASEAAPVVKSEKITASLAPQASAGTAPAANPTLNQSAAPLFNPAVATAQTFEENQTAAAIKTASVSEIGTQNVSHAASGAGELLTEAKAEASMAKSDTSFRDIYKGMSKEVVDQVKVNITKSAVKGVDKIDISLKPEELGHIQIKMQIAKDGKLQAHIISSRPETMEVLQKEIHNLEKAFNEAGFQTDEGSLSFSFQGNQAGQEQDRNSELRNYIGSVFENETVDTAAGNDNQLLWSPDKGLNIRV